MDISLVEVMVVNMNDFPYKYGAAYLLGNRYLTTTQREYILDPMI